MKYSTRENKSHLAIGCANQMMTDFGDFLTIFSKNSGPA